MKNKFALALIVWLTTVTATSAMAKDEYQVATEATVVAQSVAEKNVGMTTAESAARDAEAQGNYDDAMKNYRKALRFTEPGSVDEARLSEKIGKMNFDKNSASSPSLIVLRIILSIVVGVALGGILAGV